LKVVDQTPAEQDRVFFAARVTLEDEAGETIEICIVGADELDLDPINISVDSPMARALLKQELDAEVAVQRPDGIQTYIIVNIQYGC
jgi:transcription elongation factor GreB